MATAEGGDGRELAQPPGLGVPGPRTRRSTATGDMAVAVAPAPAGCGEEEERQMEGPQQLYVLGLAVALPLAVAVARLDAGVPRKARTIRPRAEPSDWWTFRMPVPLVKEGKNSPADGKRPVPPEAPRLDAAEQIVEKPAKRAKRCVQCGKEETPQWRSGPMGRSTLCNACGVRLRAAGALRETEQRPPPATPRKVAHPPPPPPPAESPASDSSPDNPICERRAPIGDIYLVRKQPKSERWSPRKEAAPAPSPSVYLVKKKKPSKKPRKPRNTGQRCLHCGTTSTPQWREGPMGRHTLCNACGVRHRQGRLLPEYRPAASPTFVPSEHASRHSEVLQLHRQRRTNTQPGLTGDSGDAPESDEDDKNNVVLLRRQPPEKDHCSPTPLHRTLPQPVDDDPRARGNNGLAVTPVAGCGGGDVVTDVPSSLDSQLLDVPSAPLIVDGDESLVASEP